MTAGSHSILIELLGSTGVIGLGFYYLMIIIAFQNTDRMPEDQYLYCSAFMLMYTVHGLMERGVAPNSFYTLFLYTVLGIACRYEKERPALRRRMRQLD